MNPHLKLIIVVGSVVNCEKKEDLKVTNDIENATSNGKTSLV